MTVVGKDGRVLLVVANLSKWGDSRFLQLYEWLDSNAVNLANVLMRLHYREIDTLVGSEATRQNFVDRTAALAHDTQTRAVDVFLHLHGLPGELFFEDSPVATSELAAELKAADLKQRLRLLYSTACYGASHAPDFVKAGFRVASGSKAVNANGPYDYPAQLLNWSLGKTYRMTVQAGNAWLFREGLDAVARALGFADIDSDKVIEGRVLTRISTEAD
jgi:hypothetical protein